MSGIFTTLEPLAWTLSADFAELEMACGPALVADILQSFLDDSERRLERLRAAIAVGDALVVVREGHSLKGGGAQIGAPVLAAIAARLESGRNEPESWPQLLEDCTAEFARVAALMRSHRLLSR